MANIPGNVGWVAELVPGLAEQLDTFIVATDEVDDELVEVFIEEIQRLTGDLREGMEKNDPVLVRAAAHSIKGMGGTIGLPEISVLGFQIEKMAKEGRLSDARPMVDGLAEWLTTLS